MSNNQEPQNEHSPSNDFIMAPAPGESAAAFEAFLRYLQMKKRSLRMLAEEIDVHETTVREWSAKFGWQQRILDYNTSLLKACFLNSVTIQTGVEEVKAECEKIIQSTMARVSVDFFTMGHATVKHQVRTNPEAVSIPIGIQLVNSGVKVANSLKAGPDAQNAAMAAVHKRLTGLADEYERERAAAKALPPPSSPPASVENQKD